MGVEQFECVGDVGDVYFHSDARSPLPEAGGGRFAYQTGAGEFVDGLAEPNVTFVAKSFGRRRDLWIKSYALCACRQCSITDAGLSHRRCGCGSAGTWKVIQGWF